jgi:hypothetical protein
VLVMRWTARVATVRWADHTADQQCRTELLPPSVQLIAEHGR